MKTITAYKLFRTLKTRRGLFPLFIGKSKPTPEGEWVDAENLPTKGFAHRPGWHAGILPIAPHLRQKSTGKIAPDRVWTEVEILANRNWQEVADNSPTRDVRSQVPVGGFYRFKTSRLQGGSWIIGGTLRIVRVLSDEDVSRILISAGINVDEISKELRENTVNK